MEQLANTDLHLISDFTSPEMSRYLGAGMDLFYKSLEDQNIPAVSNNKAFFSSDRIFTLDWDRGLHLKVFQSSLTSFRISSTLILQGLLKTDLF